MIKIRVSITTYTQERGEVECGFRKKRGSDQAATCSQKGSGEKGRSHITSTMPKFSPFSLILSREEEEEG